MFLLAAMFHMSAMMMAYAAIQPCERAGEMLLFSATNSKGGKLAFKLVDDTAGQGRRLCCNEQVLRFVNMDVNEDGNEWRMDESDIFWMAYFHSPDGKWLFVVLRPSIAGSCDLFYKLHLYRIDIETLEVKWIVNCGALKVTHDGIDTAQQVEWLNPDQSCAQARFTARHVYYDYAGCRVGESKVMSQRKIEKHYKTHGSHSNSDDDEYCIELSASNRNILSVF